jgi:two-component system, NarL family, response regulator NreC
LSIPIRVLICDDHAVVRAGLRLILDPLAEFEIVGEAESAEQLLSMVGHLRPDVVITDLSMPGIGGLEAIPQIKRMVPEAGVLVFTVHEDEAYFFRALRAGAAGYVLKGASSEILLAALRLVVQGGVPIPRSLGQHMMTEYMEGVNRGDTPQKGYEQLSPAERSVMRLAVEGLTNKEIAARLSVSVRTVERHRTSIMNKLGLQNRAQLISYALRRGIIDT